MQDARRRTSGKQIVLMLFGIVRQSVGQGREEGVIRAVRRGPSVLIALRKRPEIILRHFFSGNGCERIRQQTRLLPGGIGIEILAVAAVLYLGVISEAEDGVFLNIVQLRKIL